MNRELNSVVTTWAATSTTLGGVGLVGIATTGSAAVGTLTVQDQGNIKFVVTIASTAGFAFIPIYPPIAFKSLNTVVTGTSSYSLVFVPRP